MRGDKCGNVHTFHPFIGITPACAGIRNLDIYLRRGSEDHPRMRGDKGITREQVERGRGSPPHARG